MVETTSLPYIYLLPLPLPLPFLLTKEVSCGPELSKEGWDLSCACKLQYFIFWAKCTGTAVPVCNKDICDQSVKGVNNLNSYPFRYPYCYIGSIPNSHL